MKTLCCCHSYPLCVCVYVAIVTLCVCVDQVSVIVSGCNDVLGELLSRPLLFYLLHEVWAHNLSPMQHCGVCGTVVLNPEVHTLYWTIVEG